MVVRHRLIGLVAFAALVMSSLEGHAMAGWPAIDRPKSIEVVPLAVSDADAGLHGIRYGGYDGYGFGYRGGRYGHPGFGHRGFGHQGFGHRGFGYQPFGPPRFGYGGRPYYAPRPGFYRYPPGYYQPYR